MQRGDFKKGACRICLLETNAAAVIDMAGCNPSVGRTIFKPDIVESKIQITLIIFDKNAVEIISTKMMLKRCQYKKVKRRPIKLYYLNVPIWLTR